MIQVLPGSAYRLARLDATQTAVKLALGVGWWDFVLVPSPGAVTLPMLLIVETGDAPAGKFVVTPPAFEGAGGTGVPLTPAYPTRYLVTEANRDKVTVQAIGGITAPDSFLVCAVRQL